MYYVTYHSKSSIFVYSVWFETDKDRQTWVRDRFNRLDYFCFEFEKNKKKDLLRRKRNAECKNLKEMNPGKVVCRDLFVDDFGNLADVLTVY